MLFNKLILNYILYFQTFFQNIKLHFVYLIFIFKIILWI